MLGTIRLYALDRLAASGEEPAVRQAHLGWAAAMADDLERRLEKGQQWRTAFDLVADDLRAALITATSPNGHEVSHRLARTLGHLAYARRFLLESRGHYEVAAAHAPPAEAAWDLRAAADVAMAEGEGGVAFDLLHKSAERAAEAGDNAAQACALAYAATIADRFAGNFPAEQPHDRLREAGGGGRPPRPGRGSGHRGLPGVREPRGPPSRRSRSPIPRWSTTRSPPRAAPATRC